MITERRVFQAKVGQAGAVVAKIKDAQHLFEPHGWPKSTIYTDHQSGPTDRVVWNIEIESLGAMESLMNKLSDPSVQATFEKWFASLVPLIEGATVEHWHRED